MERLLQWVRSGLIGVGRQVHGLAHPELQLQLALGGYLDDLIDAKGELQMQARRHILQMLAETQHDPLRFGGHGVISGKQT